MTDTKELVFKIDAESAEKVFSTAYGLQPYLEQAKQTIDAMHLECGDVATAKGRAAHKSLARKVASLRIQIDNIGKDLVADLKEKPKRIDAERKRMRELLESWQAEIIKPVEELEELERKEAEAKLAEIAAKKLAEEIENAHELALFMNADFDAKRAQAAKEAEDARIAREKEIAERAAEQARIAAEQEAQRKLEAERAEQARKERERQEAIAAAERAVKDAEIKARQAAEQAERDRAAAIQAERDRQEREAYQARKAEEERAANIEHRRQVHHEIIECFLQVGKTEEEAKDVIRAVLAVSSPRLTINY